MECARIFFAAGDHSCCLLGLQKPVPAVHWVGRLPPAVRSEIIPALSRLAPGGKASAADAPRAPRARACRRADLAYSAPQISVSRKRQAMAAKSARPKVKKVVLAYSGGLDTSIILKWLQETYRAEVVTFTADLGQGEELEPARRKAEMLGIKKANIFVEDLREEFIRDYVFPMFRANALYEGVYLLGTSIARPLIAKKQIEIARQDRRRRGGARRHRQGQRPGALRAQLLCAGAVDQDHRAVAGVELQEPHRADRLCAQAPDPRRQGQAGRSAVLGRRQPAALLLRGQGAGGPGDRGAGLSSISAPSRRWRRRTRRPT